MKISKQERILIVVFLVAAIIGVGVFVFVLPNFNKISANNKQLATAKQEYSNVLSQLEHESTMIPRSARHMKKVKILPKHSTAILRNMKPMRLCVSLLPRARI